MGKKTKYVAGVDYADHGPASPKQEMILNSDAQILVIGGAMGGGKRTDALLPVHTPEGTKLLKDVVDGDILLNPEGGYTKVLKAHPITNTQVYRMTFSDGSVIDACGEHRWYGSWRNDKKSPFTSWDNPYCVKTTDEIFNHYENFENVKRKKYFRIPLTQPLEYEAKDLPIDPYLLGCLLGDGCITTPSKIKQTTHKDDLDFFNESIQSFGFETRTYFVKGNCFDIYVSNSKATTLPDDLFKLGLLGTKSATKFIPDDYLFGSIEQRRALLQGLLDTDGSIEDRGVTCGSRIRYYTISDELKEGFCKLAASLGYSVIPVLRPAREKKERNGKVYQCKPCWQIDLKSRDDTESFRLPRKRALVKSHKKGTWEPAITLKSVELLEEKKDMRCLTVDHPNALYVIGDGCIVTHNTYLQQLIGLRYIDDPNTRIITFRRTMEEIKGSGGVYETAEEIYSQIHPDHVPKFTPSKPIIRFPNGATATFRHMEHAKDTKKNIGLQFTLCNFDEGYTFEWEQIEFMFQRMRSKSKYKSRIVISTNPDPDHKIAELIDWYLDEDGFPDPEREGQLRYFVRRNGDFFWSSTREELGRDYDIPEEEWKDKILSFSFIGCTVFDNPPMMAANPEYLAFLEGMPEIDKARNLHGNWYARPSGSLSFERGWLSKVDTMPRDCVKARAWDKAYSEPSDIEKFPDYTAAFGMAKDTEGYFYIYGDYAQTCRDDDSLIMGKFRKRSGERNLKIKEQAEHDGKATTICVPIDPGGGKADYNEICRMLTADGFTVKGMPTNKNKLARFAPFSAACQNGFVRILEHTFNTETLEAMYKELEAFTGDRSTRSRKDDWPDAGADAYEALTEIKNHKIVRRSQSHNDSNAKEFIESRQ